MNEEATAITTETVRLWAHPRPRSQRCRPRRLFGHDHPLGRLTRGQGTVRILIALSVLAGIIVSASGALAAGSSGIGIRLVDVPADSRNDPFAGSYIVDRLAPGGSVRRVVEISNTTRSTVSVAVYPAAATFRRGTFGLAAGHDQNELSGWTSVSRKVLRMQPGTTALETVTINVPEEVSPAERYAVVWAEVSTPTSAAGGVTLVNRVGVRMYVSVGPGGAPPANFAIGSLSAERSETGAPVVVAIVHNTGRRTLDISGTLALAKGPGGLRVGPIPVTLESALAVGESGSAAAQLDERLPLGPWRAHVRLRSGSVHRTAVATITFPEYTGVALPPSAEPNSPIVAVVVILLFVLLAVAATALVYSRRRKGGGDFEPTAMV